MSSSLSINFPIHSSPPPSPPSDEPTSYQNVLVIGATGHVGSVLCRFLSKDAPPHTTLNLLMVSRSSKALERLAEEVTFHKSFPNYQRVNASHIMADVTRDISKIVHFATRFGDLDAIYYLPGIFVDRTASATAKAYGMTVNCDACISLLTQLHAASALTQNTKVLLATSSAVLSSDLASRMLNGVYTESKTKLFAWAHTEGTKLPCSITCALWTLLNNTTIKSVPTLVTEGGKDIIRFENAWIDDTNGLGNLPAVSNYGVTPSTVAITSTADLKARRPYTYCLQWADFVLLRWVIDVMPGGFSWYTFAVGQLLLSPVPFPLMMFAPAGVLLALLWFPPVTIPLLYLAQLNPFLLFIPRPGLAPLRPVRALLVNAALIYFWWWTTFRWIFVDVV